MAEVRANVIHLYRQMLRYASRMSPDQRAKNTALIRAGFREGRGAGSEERVRELVEKAQSTLGYLKIVTPRRVSDGQTGVTRTVFGSTEPSATNPRKAYSNWTGDRQRFRCTACADE